jgi:hypothetical protein
MRQRQLDRIVCASSARAASMSHARRICRGERDETAARTSPAVLASISEVHSGFGFALRRGAVREHAMLECGFEVGSDHHAFLSRISLSSS